LSYTFEAMGEQSVKNIARPVRVDAMSAAAVAATPSVAVQAQPGWLRRVVARPALLAAGLSAIIGIPIAPWWEWPRQSIAAASANAARPPIAIGTDAKTAPRLSIIVLPFANLSGDPAQDYFADGITDDLTTDLSRISGSFVIARNTAFT